jgi:hypothetical protein
MQLYPHSITILSGAKLPQSLFKNAMLFSVIAGLTASGRAQSIGDTRNVTATTHRVTVTTADMTTKPPGTHSYSYDLYLYNTCTGTSYDNSGWTTPFATLKNDLAFHFVWSGSLTVPSGKIGKIIVSKTHTAYGSTGGNENIDANELLGGEIFNGSSWEAFAWSRDERTYTNVSGTTVIEDLPGAGEEAK